MHHSEDLPFPAAMNAAQTEPLFRYINLKLVALGQPSSRATADPNFLEIAAPLLRNYHQKDQLLGGRLCPADARVQEFLDSYLEGIRPAGAPRLPSNTFALDRPGLARAMSLPPGSDSFSSPYLHSYRVAQGVLHNPKSDRRTTQGLFQIVEDGLPVPADKTAVPRLTFAKLLAEALRPPSDTLTLPFTADQNKEEQARIFVSLLLRPVVCPATGRDPQKTMEIRLFAPGTLVSNLDFVEAIFGNGGDPYLPENDAALDAAHWTGHTGCVILAPHLAGMLKKDLGLPRFEDATERQRRDGMCWRDEKEQYNEGQAFKIVCRDARGIIVTIIADNYYGYCKKEVKSQISYAANLFGGCEEEHAGGAIAFPAYVLGNEFSAERSPSIKKTGFEHAKKLLRDSVEWEPEGYGIDRVFPSIVYLPEGAEFNVREGFVCWPGDARRHQLNIVPNQVYVLPSGYRVWLEKQLGGTNWRLVGAVAHGTLCHKPCTVSGGGKSEISKSIANVLVNGPVFVRNYFHDFAEVERILQKDFSTIHKQPETRAQRPILSPDRSLGSVIKLLTPSAEYTDEYNAWLRDLPQTIRQLVFTVKRYYRPEWSEDWREHFTVDRINGFLGHELKYENHKLVGNYLRMGFDPEGSWRIFKLRPDFHPAEKLQVEDDITASVVVSRNSLDDVDPKYPNQSVKLVENCEAFLFQRPDDAIHPGFDKQAESDIASDGTFLSNFEPLTRDQARAIVDHIVEFDQYTQPMQRRLRDFVESAAPAYVVSSAKARLVEGKPSKNPRYLQYRPDLARPRDRHLAEMCARLDRGIPFGQPVHFPVNAVLAGRRGTIADPALGLPPLAVYSLVHYQELPELFMDFICSLTGKSPSTTGFGSEGALTKGPFNALPPVIDLNNAVVSAILTGYAGFTTAAGYVGPRYRVDHDISMLMPEVWCRIRVEERDPKFLIENGFLEKLNDFEHNGRKVLASRLGYRITALFAERFLGRIFETPDAVFSEEMLRPELQDPDAFAAGVNAIAEAQQRVAMNYFEDSSVSAACPPLAALLHVMAHGEWQGKKSVEDPEIRAMFTRDSLLASGWYRDRLKRKQEWDIALWKRHVASLEAARSSAPGSEFDVEARLHDAREQLARVTSAAYAAELVGTIGLDAGLGATSDAISAETPSRLGRRP
jgi:phosphoenolpyruvate carboxykinase (diphosphate)